MNFDYATVKPITKTIRADRQLAKRHYGVHPYFTRRPPNVVRSYIEHYTQPGDSVLDPFGGSGVTAIEAFLLNRQAIHNDINPLGNFIAGQIADVRRRDTNYIKRALHEVDSACGELVRRIPSMSGDELKQGLRKVRLPENIDLPKNADVPRFYDLFTPGQLLALALIKGAIDNLRDKAARNQLLLAWSATLAKLNRTFLSAKGRAESRGGSSIFSIYRYKVARSVVELPPWDTFSERAANIIVAKEEVLKEVKYQHSQGGFRGTFRVLSEDVLDLPKRLKPVDYIFTDPPYGGHIAYLDLSTIWNHWLGFSVPAHVRRKEIIVGGELGKSEEEYISRLSSSVRACLRLLKKSRWMSIVFQHWNVAYFEAILRTVEECGAELQAAVTQVGDTIWSMHKKKGQERILAGEMILTFFKTGVTRRQYPTNHIDIDELVDIVLPAAETSHALHGEVLFNRLITEAWRCNALHALRIDRDQFIGLLEQRGWHYDASKHQWVRAAVSADRQRQLW